MAASPGMGMNPALFSKCADVMKELLATEEYSTLTDSEWVKSCLVRMGLLDTKKQLTFEKVLRHEATDISTHGTGVQHFPPEESQEAQFDSRSSQDSLPGVHEPEAQLGVIEGHHGDLLEERDRPGSERGTGDLLVGFRNVAANRKDNGQGTKKGTKRNREGGAKITKHRKSRSNIKRQSKKLKRKSRRYQRRASSRKGRK